MNQAERASKRADAAINRARLREAALEAFAESGLDLEVQDIASRAQVGVATLYRHFGSREDLLRALVTEIVEDALAQIDQAIQPYPDDPRAAFQALISVGLRVFEQYRSLFTLVHDPRLTKLVDPAQGEALRAQVFGQAAGVIERGIQAGIFWDGLDPELIAATIFGSLAGVFGNLGKRSPLAELEQQLTHLLWRMVAKEGNTAFLSGSPTGEPGTAGT